MEEISVFLPASADEDFHIARIRKDWELILWDVGGAACEGSVLAAVST
jgi:hypothetical protein